MAAQMNCSNTYNYAVNIMTLDLTGDAEANECASDDYRVNVHSRRNVEDSLGNKSVGFIYTDIIS